jgi:hypothetical protein
MMRRLCVGLFVLTLAKCTDSGVQPQASDPYQRWKSCNLHDYTILQRRGCFCPDGGVTMRIVVRADTIASVTRALDGSNLPVGVAQHYCTVDSLFAIIRRNVTDSLVVTYDGTYGYPDTLDINPQLHPVDGGVIYVTSSLSIP